MCARTTGRERPREASYSIAHRHPDLERSVGEPRRHPRGRASRRNLRRARRARHRLDLQRQSRQRPARDGRELRRHRPGPQRLPVRRRHQQDAAEHRRRRDHLGPQRLDDQREGQPRRRRPRADRQGAARAQGRARLDQHLAARPLPDPDADRQVHRRLAQDRVGRRAQPAQDDHEGDPARGHGDRRAHGGRRRLQRRADRRPRRADPHVARHPRTVQARCRRRRCCTRT